MSKELVEILTPVVMAVITAAGTLLAYYLQVLSNQAKQKLTMLQDQQTSTVVARVKKEAESIIESAVNYTNQTFVAELKEKSEDGKLSAEDASEAWKQTYETVLKLMCDELYESLDDIYPDAEAWINTKIEEFIFKGKK